MDSESVKRYSTSDGIILLLLSLCVSTAVYHPYYFGDELFSFAFGMRHGDGFWGTFSELNAYKPRVLMNLIWAAIVAAEAPRWVAMIVNASAMAACAILVYRIGTRNLNATRAASLGAALVLLGSRFGVMLYFDYVSGTVETISLAAFLAGLALSASAVFDGKLLSGGRSIATIGCFLLAVAVHERFVAGLAGVMAVVSLFWLKRHWAARDFRGLFFPVLGVILPALTVVLLVKTLSSNSLAMGTSGQTVQVSGDTLVIAVTYLCNLFLGSNFGPVWFVGSLNQNHAWTGWVFGISAALLALAWIAPWLLRGKPSTATDGEGLVRYQAIGVLLAFVGGMVAVASLPGADRQEARWMFPAFAALLLLVLATYRSRARFVLLVLLAVSQAFYLSHGSLERIASINASMAAKQLGRAMDAVDFPGDAGVMVSVAEPDTSWVLGGSDGRVFCRVNLSQRNCLFSATAQLQGSTAEYGFGLTPQGANRRGEAFYRYVPRAQAAAMLDSTTLPEGGDFLGQGATWPDWTLADAALRTERGVVVAGLAENFYRLDAARVDGKFLVYRAEPVEGDRVPMRIQVNWHNAESVFLDAFIDVVDVSGPLKDYPALVIAPEGAAYGLVYATLHDGAAGKVRLESVRVVDLADAADPSGASPRSMPLPGGG